MSGGQDYSFQWSSKASGSSRLHRVNRHAQPAQAADVMSYHSVFLVLIQRR